MALVPQDLMSEYYELNKPEIRVEDNISKILNEEETPDDMKAKLLSHWIPKYQRLMQPPPQKPFEIPKELLQETEAEQEISSPAPSKLNMIAKYIAYTIPKLERIAPSDSSKPKTLTTAERLRKLSNGENLLEATETRPKKWTSWKDMRKLSNQDSSPESQKTQPVNWTTWKD
ncbi:uncharacterized protein TNCV_4571521 [Trichonephila clavipes]|nr:uncharacterized protein TNCV_4571521 [Trichonephila clavipes]